MIKYKYKIVWLKDCSGKEYIPPLTTRYEDINSAFRNLAFSKIRYPLCDAYVEENNG